MKISFIASIFKTKEWIQDYLLNIVNVEEFNDHELVLVNPLSPDSEIEDLIINEYVKKFKNIKYIKVNNNLGLYETWNYAIKNSSGDYISNANPDDRKLKNFITDFKSAIKDNPEIDIFYADSLIAKDKSELIFPQACSLKYKMPEISVDSLIIYNPPHQAPVWKKSIHEKIGYFSDDYGYAGDHEFWLRCFINDLKFKKLDKICGIYYFNPQGMSTNANKNSLNSENVKTKYSRILGYEGKIHGRLEDIIFNK